MNRKDFKDKWIAALRSAEYSKTEDVYFDSDTNCYCTLGVAYKLLQDDNEFEDYMDILNSKLLFEIFPELNVGHPSRLWSEITDRSDGVGFEKHSFEQMADYLEENLIV
jgi:hypothetical protein